MAKTRNPRRKAPPWRFVKGAPAGYRKLKNRITGKTRLIKVGRARSSVSRRKPGRMQRSRRAFRTLKPFRRNPAGSTPDSTAAHELSLYGINTSELYFQSAKPIIANLADKVKRGNYDPTRALKLWEFHAEKAARRYAKEFASPSEWNTIFTAATRRLAAREFARHYQEELDRESGRWRSVKNPARSKVRIRRTARGRYQVKSGKRLTARGTSRLRAMRQATLIRSVKRGWRPTGKPALGARRKMAGLKGSNMLAFRKKRKWTVIRGSMKAGRFRVVKRGLSDGALKKWARAEKHKLRQL